MIINIKGYDVLVDDDIAPMILARKWHVSRRKNRVYFASTVYTKDGKSYEIRLHRLLACAVDGLSVDHKNGNTLDNRRENLRVCTNAENTRNQPDRRRSKAGYRGVVQAGDRFKAKIMHEGKNIHIGYFNTAEEASQAYERKAKELFGEFYREEELAQ
jgi:hypothetical protein